MQNIFLRTALAGVLLHTLVLSGCGNGSSPAASVNSATGAISVESPLPAPPAKTSSLAAPGGVTATSGINKVTLSWDAIPDATSYNIYWSVNPNVTTATGTKISTPDSPYNHEGLTVSQTYFYVVTAVNSTGESLASAQAATVSATNGANLYSTYCQNCHGPAAASNIKNGTPDSIKAAIAANKGGMRSLPALSQEQIDLISTQLPCH